ncbi:MAG: dihydrofolate reductase [Mucinivorans sp.]
MKKLIFPVLIMSTTLFACAPKVEKKIATDDFQWQVDRFDDVKVLQYQVHGFDSLSIDQKKLVYYLSQAALTGRDILFDQHFKYNLAIRRTLESIYENYTGTDRESDNFKNFEIYLKKVWFANGIHHHYSEDKFVPKFTEAYFDELLANTPAEKLLPNDKLAIIRQVIFDPKLYPKRVNQTDGEDLVLTSAVNFYDGVNQSEVEAYYDSIEVKGDPRPVSYGLNTKLVKENGKVVEKPWKIGGIYSAALEQTVNWLEKAATVAENEKQRQTIEKLISYYKTGSLGEFDEFNILWVADNGGAVDFVNGFTETYTDPLGRKASWESLVNFKDFEATKLTKLISDNAKWFEDNSPIPDKYKKKEVRGVSAKVITAAMLGGDSYPATAIGINLPNADWIRLEHGSKSVTIANITEAYDKSAIGNGFGDEFILMPEDRELRDKWGAVSGDLTTDLHECLGHGSGCLAPGTKGDELKNYASPLEEARADLFALYYIADQKMVDVGIMANLDIAKAAYYNAIMNGMMTQLTRIELGKNIEQAHMRDRALIANWAYELGKAKNVIEKVVKDNKTYIKINDYTALRNIFGTQLSEIQRIKSEGDYAAGRELIEKYAVKIDPKLHKEIKDRFAALNIAPYSGFINPRYVPVEKDGQIVDVKIEYPGNYVEQMLEYSKNYSFL